MTRSLVTGVTGQDGWYLTEALLARGHEVFGLHASDDDGEVPPGVQVVPGDLRDSASLAAAVEAARPQHVYNLAALSSVQQSWADPELVSDVNGTGVVRLLRAAHDFAQRSGGRVAFVQAGSAEIFGDAPAPQDEQTPIRPMTPYGAAKAFAHHAVGVYRAAGLAASNAILYNHESPRRPDHFVTRKITAAVASIHLGSDENLVLGDLDVHRDWGFAGDYMAALVLIAEHERPGDYVIATGRSHTVRDFVVRAFRHVGIEDWERFVVTDPALQRAPETYERRGDATWARTELKWQPRVTLDDLVAAMVDADLARLSRRPRAD